LPDIDPSFVLNLPVPVVVGYASSHPPKQYSDHTGCGYRDYAADKPRGHAQGPAYVNNDPESARITSNSDSYEEYKGRETENYIHQRVSGRIRVS
jgi:hypothetical protein